MCMRLGLRTKTLKLEQRNTSLNRIHGSGRGVVAAFFSDVTDEDKGLQNETNYSNRFLCCKLVRGVFRSDPNYSSLSFISPNARSNELGCSCKRQFHFHRFAFGWNYFECRTFFLSERGSVSNRPK